IYAMSDALVLCTLEEPFGRCIIEALAMGLPVVVPNTCGPAEIICDQEDGILYDAIDPEKLAEALIRLIHDLDLRAKLSTNGRKKASFFDIASHINQVQSLYETVLNPSHASGQGNWYEAD
ncbi:MAG: glycosyltransferase family 4 protein, partial [Acidobacteria bacterium]|nr:glycosyltransferase family 4 protein [Acidobacteriota bacterium]